MKQGSLIWSCAVLTSTALLGCVPGDTGGGGGLGSFSRGFAFLRDRDVYVADDSNVSNPLVLTMTGDNQNPSLSKDGRRVVFVRGGSELWVVNTTNGATPSRVLAADSSRMNLRTPVFSPDGSSIVFAYDRSGLSYLGRVNADGTGSVTNLSSSPWYTGPSFYPDGSAVLVANGSSPSRADQIVRVAMDGTTQTIQSLTGSEACSIANRVAVSPDSTRAAFDAQIVSGGYCIGPIRIFVISLFLGNPTRLTNYADPAIDGFPTWVGNSQVGYSSNFGGADQVYVLSAAASMTSGSLKVPTASQPYYGPN